MTLSYDPNTIHASLQKELARLQAQLDCGWDVEFRSLRRAGVEHAQDIVELGCGPGLVTERLLAALPQVRLTAIDNDPDMITRGRARITEPRVRWQLADAAVTGLPSECCDVVLSRYLFQHLPEPQAVAQEAWRILRPGGQHIIIDVDDACWGLADPAITGLQEIYAQAAVAQAERNGDRLIGRRLGRILRKAGHVDVNLEPFAVDSDVIGLEAMRPQLSPERLLPAMTQGYLSMQEYIRAQFLLERFMATPGAHVIQLGFIAQGVKGHEST